MGVVKVLVEVVGGKLYYLKLYGVMVNMVVEDVYMVEVCYCVVFGV